MSNTVEETRARRVDEVSIATTQARTRNRSVSTKWLLVAAGIVLLGAVLRLVWMMTQAPVINSDGGEYARMAEHLRQDHALIGNFEGPEILYGPLFPILTAGVMTVVPDSETAAHVVSLLSGVALIVLSLLTANYVYGRRTATICACLVAIHPLLVALSGSVYNETLYLTLWMGLLYCSVRLIDRWRLRDGLLLGTFAGLAYLTRIETVAYFLLALLAALAIAASKKRVRSAMAASAAAIVAFGILASPYVLFLQRHTGHLVLEAKWDINYTMARNRLAGMNPIEADYGVGRGLAAKGPLLDPFAFSSFTPYTQSFREEIGTLWGMAWRNARSVYEDLTAREFGPPLLSGLILLAWFARPWSNRRLRHEVLLLLLAGALVFVVLTSATAEFRYMFPLLPMLLLWSAKGVDVLVQTVGRWELFIRGKPHSPPMALTAGLAACALLLVSGLAFLPVRSCWLFKYQRSSTATAVRSAGIWLAQHDPGPKRIATQLTVLPYYAKGTLKAMPYGDPDAAEQYLLKQKVDYVVLDSDEARAFPNVSAWLEHGLRDPTASRIYEYTDGHDTRVVIYRMHHDASL